MPNELLNPLILLYKRDGEFLNGGRRDVLRFQGFGGQLRRLSILFNP